MKLTITQFAALTDAADVTIHSLEQALYQVTVAPALRTSSSSGQKGQNHPQSKSTRHARDAPDTAGSLDYPAA